MRIIRSVHDGSGFVVLDLVGSLDNRQDRDMLIAAIQQEIDERRGKIILRMDDLTAIDHLGVATIIYFINSVGLIRGIVALSGVKPHVQESFRNHQGPKPVVRMYPDEATAIAQATLPPTVAPA